MNGKWWVNLVLESVLILESLINDLRAECVRISMSKFDRMNNGCIELMDLWQVGVNVMIFLSFFYTIGMFEIYFVLELHFSHEQILIHKIFKETRYILYINPIFLFHYLHINPYFDPIQQMHRSFPRQLNPKYETIKKMNKHNNIDLITTYASRIINIPYKFFIQN